MPWVCQDCGHDYPSSRSRCTECKSWDVEHVRQVKETVAVGGEIPDIPDHEPEVERGPDVRTDGSVGEQPEEAQWSDAVSETGDGGPSLWSRLSLTTEIYGTKTKGHLRTVVGLLGIGLVCLGAYNMLLAPVTGTPVVAPYRIFGIQGTESGGLFALGDVIVMAVGAIAVWLS